MGVKSGGKCGNRETGNTGFEKYDCEACLWYLPLWGPPRGQPRVRGPAIIIFGFRSLHCTHSTEGQKTLCQSPEARRAVQIYRLRSEDALI